MQYIDHIIRILISYIVSRVRVSTWASASAAAAAPPPGRSISVGGSALVGCVADPSDPPRRRRQVATGDLPPHGRLDLLRLPRPSTSPPSRASGPAPPLSPCAATTAALGAGALQQEEARGALSCRAVGGTAVGPVAAPQTSSPAPRRDPSPTVASGLLAAPSSRRSTAVAGGLQRHGGSALPRRLSLL